MTSYKEKLKQKLIEFQRNIANQKLLIAQTKDEFQEKELAHYLSLFELLDAFENINNTIEEKKDSFDKTAKMLGRNIRSIHRKLLRLVEASGIVQIEFQENKAVMKLCKIIETRQEPDIENETILNIIKHGYMDKETKKIIRKAEVITVLNE